MAVRVQFAQSVCICNDFESSCLQDGGVWLVQIIKGGGIAGTGIFLISLTKTEILLARQVYAMDFRIRTIFSIQKQQYFFAFVPKGNHVNFESSG